MDSQGIKNIGIALLGLTGAWGIWYFIKGKDNPGPGSNDQTSANLQNIQVDKSQLRQPENNYNLIADNIYRLLEEYWLDTADYLLKYSNLFSFMYYAFFPEYFNGRPIFDILNPLNAEELKQVIKSYDLRKSGGDSVVKFFRKKMTLYEVFDQVLNNSDLATMKALFAKTGLPWTSTRNTNSIAAYGTYLEGWLNSHIGNRPPSETKKLIGASVYYKRTGVGNINELDGAWPNLDSFNKAQKAGNGLKIPVYTLRTGDAINPVGKIVGISPSTGNKTDLVMIEFTHPALYRNGVLDNSLKGQRAWVYASNIITVPYNPPAMHGLGNPSPTFNQPLLLA